MKLFLNAIFHSAELTKGYGIVRNFPGKITFANFEVLWLFVKVFSVKFGGVASFGGTSNQSVESFPLFGSGLGTKCM